MGAVKSITALALADRVFAPKVEEVEPEQSGKDLAVYASVEYSVNNDGNIHIVIPGAIALASLQQKKTAKNAAFIQVKAESVDVNITQELPDGKTRETTLTTKPVEFELRFMFDKPETEAEPEVPAKA